MSTVMMPILCLSEDVCINCKNLEISIDRQTFFSDHELETINTLYCTNYNMCNRIAKKIQKVGLTSERNNQSETD